MDIKEIDKNFADARADSDGMKRYTLPCGDFDLYGVFHDGERFLRMPKEIAAQTSEGVAKLNKHTSGGRVRFSTDSEKIEITVAYDALVLMPHMPLSGSGGFILIDDTEEGTPKLAGTYFPEKGSVNGFSLCKVINPAKTMRSYTLYMPLYNDVKTLMVGLDGNAALAGGKKYRPVKPILYYGSSITQGGCASRPDTCYQAVISLWSNTDYINLGFSGHAKGEQAIADYLSDMECSVFVCDYDHNAPNAEHLEKTHHKLYKTFRNKQADTPIIFLSMPDAEYDRGQKRFEIIERTYLTAQNSGDKNVYLINGYDLYAEEDRILCAVDGRHPTDRGFYLMAKKLWGTLKGLI